MSNVVIAFALTTIAGLSTGIGSAIAFFAKKTNTKFLAASLGFSAGVMIYVSMMELLGTGIDTLSIEIGQKTGTLIGVVSFFGGIVLIGIIDKLVPEAENPHHALNAPKDDLTDLKLMRTGKLTALVIAIHNFPEGLATFVSSMQDMTIAIPIVVAIAIHNIPEGIAVSMPIYYATGDSKKAFKWSFLSGLSEPLGALVGYLILRPFMNETVNGVLFGVIAGIMVYISLDELLPTAREYGDEHLPIYGLFVGMFVMAISLWMFI